MASIQQRILDVVYNCGGITKRGVEKIAGNDLILKEFLEKKILKKQPIEIQDKKIALYTITDFGERLYTEQTGKKHFFRCSRGEKVVALSYFYISEIENCNDWRNKDEWYAHGEHGLIPDGTYYKNGEQYGIVVVRKSERNRAEEQLKTFSENQQIKQIKIMIQ